MWSTDGDWQLIEAALFCAYAREERVAVLCDTRLFVAVLPLSRRRREEVWITLTLQK